MKFNKILITCHY